MLAVLAASSAALLDAQRDTRPGSAGSAIIRGRVTAADTGLPVRDALIRLQPVDGTNVIAYPSGFFPGGAPVDAEGRFELSGIAAGAYRIVASPGPLSLRYLPARHPDPTSEAAQPLTVAAGQVLDGVEIALPRAGALSGRVVDENGEPFGNTSVVAIAALPGQRHVAVLPGTPGANVRTDDRGRFRVYGLRPGSYYLLALSMTASLTEALVRAPGEASTRVTGYAPTYYPATQSIAEATPVEVKYGDDHTGLDLVIGRSARLFSVRGVVFDTEGRPAPMVAVSIDRNPIPGTQAADPRNQPGPFGAASTRRTDELGAFQLTGLPRGENTLNFYRYAGAAGEFASVTVTIAEDIEDLAVRLHSGVNVTGRVRFLGTAPASHASLQVRAIPLRPIGGVNATGAQPDTEGHFTLDRQFGPILIRADGLPGWHLESVHHAGRDITNTATEFTTGAGDVEVILTQRTATVTGVVRSSAGAPTDATVVIFSNNPTLWFERATTSKTGRAAGNGTFRVEGLRPGAYFAIALPTDEGSLSGASRPFFDLLASHATPLTLGEADRKTLDLRLVSLGAQRQ